MMVDDLTQFDDAILIDLKARIALELDRRRSGADPTRERELLGSVNAVLQMSGGEPLHWAALTHTRLYPKFKEAAVVIASFIDRHLKISTGAERKAIELLLVKMAVRYLNKRRVPISPTSIIQQLGQPSKYVEDQLPGYLSSGLLGPALLRKALS